MILPTGTFLEPSAVFGSMLVTTDVSSRVDLTHYYLAEDTIILRFDVNSRFVRFLHTSNLVLGVPNVIVINSSDLRPRARHLQQRMSPLPLPSKMRYRPPSL